MAETDAKDTDQPQPSSTIHLSGFDRIDIRRTAIDAAAMVMAGYAEANHLFTSAELTSKTVAMAKEFEEYIKTGG